MRALTLQATCLVVVAFVVTVFGCRQSAEEELQFQSYAEGAVQVGLRELRYNLFGGGEVATTENPLTASLSFARGTMTLDDTQVRIDNGDVVPLPEESKIVRVHFTDGQLRIAADGKRIYSGDFRSAENQIQ